MLLSREQTATGAAFKFGLAEDVFLWCNTVPLLGERILAIVGMRENH
jgi:hypothetical protein